MTAPALATRPSRGLLGRGRRGRARARAALGTSSSGRAHQNPDLSGNRSLAREERAEDEEAGVLLGADAGADTVREGRCGKGRGGDGPPGCPERAGPPGFLIGQWIDRDFPRGPLRDRSCHSGFKHVERGA